MRNAWLQGLVGGLVLLGSGCGAGKAAVAPAPRKALVVARSEFATRGRRGGSEYVFPSETHRFVAAGRWWEVGPSIVGGVHASTAVDEPVVRAVATAHATFLVGHQGVWLTETFDGPAKRVRYSGVSDEIGVFDDAIVVIDGNRLFRIDARTGQSATVGPTDPLLVLPALPALPALPRRGWFSLFTVRRNVVFLREGRRLFHVAANGSADRWTEQPVPLPFPVYSLEVDATGELLLVGGGDGSYRRVDATGAVVDGPGSTNFPAPTEPPPKVRRTACDGAGAGEQKAICVLLDDGWRTFRWPGNEGRRDLEGAVAFSDPAEHGAGFLVVARDGFVRLYRLHADGTVTRARHGKGYEYGCSTAPVRTVLAVNRDGTVLLEDGGLRSPGALRSIATNGCTSPRPTLLSPREFHAIGTSGRHVLALSDDGLFEGYFGEDGFRLEKVRSIPLLDAAATFPRWQHASDVTFVCDPEACTLKSPEDASIRRFWTLP